MGEHFANGTKADSERLHVRNVNSALLRDHIFLDVFYGITQITVIVFTDYAESNGCEHVVM